MKKLMYGLSVLILASMILAACGSPAPEAKTLKIYLLDYTPETIAWLKDDINPAFEAAHPGVTVEITEGSWTGWDTTFSGFFSAGEGPDIKPRL